MGFSYRSCAPISGQVANGTSLEVVGRTVIELRLGKYTYWQPFLVCQNLNVPALLGANFLARHAKVCDFEKLKMVLFDPKDRARPRRRASNAVPIAVTKGDLSALAISAKPPRWHDLSHLQEPFRSKVEALLRRFDHLFSWDGRVKPSKIPIAHRIETYPGVPPRCLRNRRFNPYKLAIMKDIVAKFEAEGHIVKSTSQYAAQGVLANKYDEAGNVKGHRLTFDYRQLNNDTVPASHPPPLPESISDELYGFRSFVKMDCSSGFHQILNDPETRHKTAFRIGNQLYEWVTMPMGLRNSPATYQAAMEMVLEPVLDRAAHLFYDDILVKGRDDDQLLVNLEDVLVQCDKYGVTINPDKCEFFKPKINFLGNVISAEGVRPAGPKLAEIAAFPRPINRKQLRSFLGFANFLRRFIPNYADIAAGMTRLQSVKVPYRWDEAAESSFTAIKKAFQSAPVIAFPNFDLPWRVYADASNQAIGAVITQVQDGEERIIDTASRVLSPAERNYTVTERECLAIHYAVADKFKHFLWGSPYEIEVISDHAALQWLASIEEPSQRLWRWILGLQNYRIRIRHRPGADQLADAMSRMGETEEVTVHPALNLVINAVTVADVDPIPTNELVALQLADINFGRILQAKANGEIEKPNLTDLSDKGRILLDQWSSIGRDEQSGAFYVLKRRPHVHRVFIAPSAMLDRIFELAHSSPRAGHLGVRRTLAPIQENFYWPLMSKDISDRVRQCQPCGCRKTVNLAKAPLKPITANRPFEVMGADLAGPLPNKSKRGHRYVFVLTDKFSHFLAAYPLKHASTEEVIDAFNRFAADFDSPQRLVTDRGSCFASRIFRGWCLARGISKKRTTAYYPRCDGMTERAVQTVKNMLFCVCPQLGQDWDRALPFIVEAHRKAANDGLDGMTPYEVVRGFAPEQQSSLLLGDVAQRMARHSQPPNEATPEEHAAFVAAERQRIEALVSESLRQTQTRMKAQHDRRVPRHVRFFEGDRVRLLLPPDQQHIARYSEDIYLVLAEPHADVYVIRRADNPLEEPDTVNMARMKLFVRATANVGPALARTESEDSTSVTTYQEASHQSLSIETADTESSSDSSSSSASSEATLVADTTRTRKPAKLIDYATHIRGVAAWVDALK